MKRIIELLVVHCSATPPKLDWGVEDIRMLHVRANGWSDVGYHYVIKRDGTVEAGRPLDKPGAHVRGHNSRSIGICLIGGVDEKGRAEENYIDLQWLSLELQLRELRRRFPRARICGHRDLSPDKNGDGTIDASEWIKQCPCFDVGAWCAEAGIDPSER